MDREPTTEHVHDCGAGCPRQTTRRAVMAGGVGGGALLLGACGSSDDEGSADGSSSSGGSTSEGTASGGTEVAAADVPEGGGTVVDESVVVTQPVAGEYHAFDAECPHQGCAVTEVTAEAITCPCHGSTFDPATGEVTKGPAESGLTAREVTLDGDTLVVA